PMAITDERTSADRRRLARSAACSSGRPIPERWRSGGGTGGSPNPTPRSLPNSPGAGSRCLPPSVVAALAARRGPRGRLPAADADPVARAARRSRDLDRLGARGGVRADGPNVLALPPPGPVGGRRR